MVYIIALLISENPFTFRTSATTLNVCKRNNKIDQMNQGHFHQDFFYRILVLSYKVYLMVAGSFDHPFFPQSRTAVHFQGLLDLSKDSFENGESEPQHRRGGSFGSGS